MYLAAVAGGDRHGGHNEKDEVAFCSFCGQLGGDQRLRVCSKCNMGVLLRTDARALRSPATPFLIVRADGFVSAASATAERELGADTQLIGRPLGELFRSKVADALEHAVTRAAAGEGGVVTLPVLRLEGRRFRGDLEATIAPCGDPAAAIVTIERRLKTP
jgi:hypothetical protein